MTRVFEQAYGPIVRQEFRKQGLPYAWGMAIARFESGFDPTQVKATGGDALYGNAWGLCQMTLVTAKALGYAGEGSGLLEPRLNAQLAAKLCAQLAARFGKDLLDVYAGYNSNKAFASASPKVQQRAKTVLQFAAGYDGKFEDEPLI